MDGVIGPITQEALEMWETVRDFDKRSFAHQALNLALIVFSVLMFWKTLILVTGSEGPLVVVLSGSMEPAYYRGDVLFLTNWNSNDPFQVGEVIVYKLKDKDIPIVHRIIAVHDGPDGQAELLTRGDNNPGDDRGLYNPGQRWVKKEEVLGRAKAYIPYLGFFTIMMQDYPKLKFLLIGLMGLFAITTKEAQR